MHESRDPVASRWARLRFLVVGGLLKAPPARDELKAALAALARREWRHPASGESVRFGVSTIERWYYAARAHQDPMPVLLLRRRRDASRLFGRGDHPADRLGSKMAEASLHAAAIAASEPRVNCGQMNGIKPQNRRE